jgi:hypothetical protein
VLLTEKDPSTILSKSKPRQVFKAPRLRLEECPVTKKANRRNRGKAWTTDPYITELLAAILLRRQIAGHVICAERCDAPVPKRLPEPLLVSLSSKGRIDLTPASNLFLHALIEDKYCGHVSAIRSVPARCARSTSSTPAAELR